MTLNDDRYEQLLTDARDSLAGLRRMYAHLVVNRGESQAAADMLAWLSKRDRVEVWLAVLAAIVESGTLDA